MSLRSFSPLWSLVLIDFFFFISGSIKKKKEEKKLLSLLIFKILTHRRFKRTLIYYDTDTQSTNFRGNPLCQATKRLNG